MVIPLKRLFIFCMFLATAASGSAIQDGPQAAHTPASAELLRLLAVAGDSLILSGQCNSAPQLHRCTNRIEEITGVTPAIWGSGFTMTGRVDNGAAVVKEAYRRYRQGYIVALTWIPSNPKFNPPFNSAAPDYNGLSAAEWEEVTTPGSRLYQKFRRDIDRIAYYLKELQRMGVPVLWHPFPAINSEQQWYSGRRGEQGSLSLWEAAFMRLTQHHGLRNLVWVWSIDAAQRNSNEFIPPQHSFNAAAVSGDITAMRPAEYYSLLEAADDKPVGVISAQAMPPVSFIDEYSRFSFFVTAAEDFDENNEPKRVLSLYRLPAVLTHKDLRAGWKPVAAALPADWYRLSEDSLTALIIGLAGKGIEGVLLTEAEVAGADSLETLAAVIARAGLEAVYECEFRSIEELFDGITTAALLKASLVKVKCNAQPDSLFSIEEIVSAVPAIDSLLAAEGVLAAIAFHPSVPFEAVQQSLEIFQSIRFGLHLDPAYCIINRLDPGHIARTLAPFIFSVDFTDYTFMENETGWQLRAVPPGEGNAGLEDIIQGLKEYGNTAYAMVSLDSSEGQWVVPEAKLLALKQCLFPQRPELKKYYAPAVAPSLRDKIEGMLIGSAIGDAAGGPVEFVEPPERSYWSTTAEPLSQQGVEELAALFTLRDYPKDIEPYAQWEPYGPAGTITDDTRFKFILFNTLRDNGGELNAEAFAREILEFRHELKPEYRAYYDEWIPEIRYAARWMLQEEHDAFPTERIWGGVPTMMGQMPFLPIAALRPDGLQWCYTKAFETAFFDNGAGRDINAAIVAGLARALQPDGSWLNAIHAMRVTDPYHYNDLLYVERGLEKWISFSHKMVKESRGNVAALFSLLENHMHTEYWWEAWVPLVVVLSCAEITGYHPLASMQLMLEFGHDTDSYAQVMGAFMGAVHGRGIFPEAMRNSVNQRMKEQFGQDVYDWMRLIDEYATGHN